VSAAGFSGVGQRKRRFFAKVRELGGYTTPLLARRLVMEAAVTSISLDTVRPIVERHRLKPLVA
jgi:hypothetical protein